MKYILSIDQGTTSSRAILFDKNMQVVASSQEEFTQHFPKSGWVEHDPEDILTTTINSCHRVIQKAGIQAQDIIAIGITNQRETTVVWDKETGKPIHNAIVWQDRRTSDYCKALIADGNEAVITEKTGLLLDPYFSATKLQWILENIEGTQQKAAQGKLLFGTIDCYLIWQLTKGKSHFTDATNAARTMLYNIAEGEWDAEICDLLRIPMNMLPQVKNCADDFGTTAKELLGAEIPIYGVAGDQQAATIGQACFQPGMIKSTYGTGCFALLNTGDNLVQSKNRLLSTIAYQLDGKTTYALEGSIFNAGTVVQWLRDGLKIIENAEQTQTMAEAADDSVVLYLVPAFTGLGAPYWDANCRGALFGLTRNSGRNEFARAALQSVAYQTRDLLEAMYKDWDSKQTQSILRVDGGMSASNWTIQFLADILGAQIDRPKVLETTALGVAWLAGMKAGFYPQQEAFAKSWEAESRFTAQMSDSQRDKLYAGWQDAVSRTLSSS